MIEARQGWRALPIEIHLLILTHLPPEDLVTFREVNAQCAAIAMDPSLCEDTLTRHFPLAAARWRSEHNRPSRGTVFHALCNAVAPRNSILNGKAKAYHEFALHQELPPRYADNITNTPRMRHKSRYNFGVLALYFTGNNIFLLINARTNQVSELALPSQLFIRDVFVEENQTYVLTTRTSTQFVLVFNNEGSLDRTINTLRDDLSLVLANTTSVVLYTESANIHGWIVYRDGLAIQLIPNTSSASHSSHAIDDSYFYQLDGTSDTLMIYDLDHLYCVSKIAGLSSTMMDDSRALVCTINRHCYIRGAEHFSFIRGLDMVRVNMPDFPISDSALWASHFIVDIGGWVGWFGDTEDGFNYGAFCILPASHVPTSILDCGRLRGPSEPEEQHEIKSVQLHGDSHYLICVMDGRVLVWTLS